MRLSTLISLPHEPWLEKWARLRRFQTSLASIKKQLSLHSTITVIDFGCGQDILYYKYLRYYFPNDIRRIKYIGIDPLLQKSASAKVTLLQSTFETTKLSQKADVIVMFAVIEHVQNPVELLGNAYSSLKKGGIIIATTPSPVAKPVLEFFSYVLGIISIREIDEHKRYPTKKSLFQMCESLKQKNRSIRITHRYFEAGLNNFLMIQAS